MDSWSWEGEGGEGEEEVAVGSDDEDIEGAGGKEDGDEEIAGDTTLLELFNVSSWMRSISNEVHANANGALTDWFVARRVGRQTRERERREAKRLRKMKSGLHRT